jgi:hypothetical protein
MKAPSSLLKFGATMNREVQCYRRVHEALSSSGLGQWVLIPQTRVRLPVASHEARISKIYNFTPFFEAKKVQLPNG